ncbi:MAG: anaerobic ribonucleoside-triphosphate reductase activating protein [Clostridia bacterium]|nr:anaerobic ribonucleoside-triphosphate reductase activating protein [Clostridia bacterium]MBR2972883.1 anaerobic ribonucleoside-triphosphate reductase activating protein [Clostridia bacterium]MBR3576214.1 anaerobic ribonucleoside-triphosphate reductase activating protein [Clostridia bacterium]
MIFGGFQKLTLLDFPGRVACTLFTKGCNFRCPFCHNALLVTDIDEVSYTDTEILDYLKKRIGILDGVCITGGEPLMQKELEDFIKNVRALGYAVKLDTNGSYPDKLKDLVNKGLIDYVAMDIKNTAEKYPLTAGVPNANVEESIDFLLSGAVPYEFRTTVVAEHHNIQDIEEIAKRISGAEKYFLQKFVDSGHLIGENLHELDENTMKNMLDVVKKYVKTAELRGI